MASLLIRSSSAPLIAITRSFACAARPLAAACVFGKVLGRPVPAQSIITRTCQRRTFGTHEQALLATFAPIEQEHQAILRSTEALFNVLSEALQKKTAGGRFTGGPLLPAQMASELLALMNFNKLVNEYHIKMEEGIIMSMLVKAGMAADSAPIATMRTEHKKIMSLGNGLMKLLEVAGTEDATLETAQQALALTTSFSELLKAHITREERTFFPMAHHFLSYGPDKHLRTTLAAELKGYHDEKNAAFKEMERADWALVKKYEPKSTIYE